MEKKSDSIFRLRPANKKTLDELRSTYLWFSRPTGFNDIEDANVCSFIDNNISIRDSFERLYKDHLETAKLASFTGICCFTENLPEIGNWRNFPSAYNGICIEYNKELLECHFLNKYFLGDCFKKVDYQDKPTTFNSYSDYDIEWEKYDDGSISYRTLLDIEKCPKSMDELYLKMFTRINSRFKNQKEFRIILGGRNIPDKSEHIQGYKIGIPSSAIKGIHYHPDTPQEFRKEADFLGK